MKASVLAVPALEAGRGGGHLARAAALVSALRAVDRDAWLYVPAASAGTLAAFPGNLHAIAKENLRSHTWDWIVLDKFRTSPEEFEFWRSLGSLIGIDEGGPCRDRFDFLLDLLPGLPGRRPPNLSAPVLLPLPKNRKERPFSLPGPNTPLRILVSFGAEDSAGLTVPLCRALRTLAGPERAEISALFGPLYRAGKKAPGIAQNEKMPSIAQNSFVVLQARPELREELADYDLVLSHFGLTAFEALHAGVPVLLASPGPYHEKLARAAGLVSAGIGRRAAGNLPRILGRDFAGLAAIASRSRECARKLGLDQPQKAHLADYINSLVPVLPRSCPVCGEAGAPPALARFPGRTYRRCPRCGMIALSRTGEAPIEYDADYFLGAYRNQYGKTYLEDFGKLKALGKARLHRLRRYLGERTGPQRLLDIGCAYGPFLAAAAEGGFVPLGLEPAEAAAAYVRDKLRIPCITGYFPAPGRRELNRPESFDVLTLWYVLEHFREPRKVLEEIRRILKPGGVLAFSTPSFAGVSGRKSPRSFLESSPDDHWTLWDPRKLKAFLASQGFELKEILVTGHHPERFPLLGRRAKPGRPLYRILEALSRFFGLGDTFEAYAIRK